MILCENAVVLVYKDIFLDTNMENGGFRGLLGIEKMVLCSKLCCNIAKLKKTHGQSNLRACDWLIDRRPRNLAN